MVMVVRCQTMSTEKSHSGSGSPAAQSSSPASKSTPIPEAASELESTGEQRRPEPLSTKPSRVAAVAETQDAEKSPLNLYAQAATSTISEWFGTLNVVLVFSSQRSVFLGAA